MTPSQKIDEQIASYHDWRGPRLAELRKLINEADPNLEEEWKWGTAVWTHHGLVCAISAFKDHCKMNFFQGAVLPDPDRLFNSGLDSKLHRSINWSEGDILNEPALVELIHAAVAFNEIGR